MKKALYNQLHQIYMQGYRGVWAGDLIDKESTRELIRMGLIDNTGGPPSSIDRVYINRKGRVEYEAFQSVELSDEVHCCNDY